MAHQAFRQVVKKVVSASSAVIATSADDCKDDMDEIAHLVFGAALPPQGTTTAATTTPTSNGAITPTRHQSICEGPIVPVTCTTPPAGHPLQVHSNPTTNAAIVSLGRRMAANAAIQRGVMETISQSGWLMYGSGGMFIPLEDSDDPGWATPKHAQGEISDEEQPGIPLSDDEDWEEDFGVDAGVVVEEEALARSFPHMSIVGPAPRPLPNSNSVPLLSSMASASASVSASVSHDESPQFSPTITPTPSRTSSIASATSAIDSEVKVQASPPHTVTEPPTRTSTRTPTLEERRRARAKARRKLPGIIPSFVSWIRSFFVDIPTPPSTSTSSATPEQKHAVADPAHDEKHGAVIVSGNDEPSIEGVPVAPAFASASASTSTSSSTAPKSHWWSRVTQSTIITAAIGVATVLLILVVTKRVNPGVFAKVVAYLRR